MLNSSVAGLLLQLGSPDPRLAWSSFLGTYADLIYEVVRWFERDTEKGEDCFLFVCEQLSQKQFRRLRRFNPEGSASFPTWLRAVVRNLCLDWHRRRSGRYRVFQSVAGLPDFDQQVFHYVFEEGMSADDCVESLKPKFAAVSVDDVLTSVQHLRNTLSPHQMWLLSARRRRAQLMSDHNVEADCNLDVRDPSPDPEVQAALNEELDSAGRALAWLPDPDRLLLLLRYEQELPLAEVAKVLGLKNPQSADHRIREVLARVREYLGVRAIPDGKTVARSVQYR